VPTGIVLRGVWGRSATEVFVVGDSGTLLRSTDKGMTWQAGTGIDPTYSLWAVGGTATTSFAAVENMAGGGTGGLYSSSNGTGWTLMPSFPASGNPLDTFWSTASDVWVAGGSGDVYHYSGTSWSSNVGTGAANGYFASLSGYGTSVLLAASSHGELFRYTSSWAEPFNSTSTGVCQNGFTAVSAGQTRAVVVGAYGCIGFSTDQGVNWRAFDFGGGYPAGVSASPYLTDFNGVWADPSSPLFVVVGKGGKVIANPPLP
jgi:photosystem II stability/assembly factor-like uncharacterized protein